VTCVVARGRTVVVPSATETTEFYRPHPETGNFVLVKAPKQISHITGAKVSLPRSEFDHLLEHGFVIDPLDTAAIAALNNPVASGR